MAEFSIILFMGIVCKNIVNVIKMMRKEKLNALYLVLSGVFGVLIAWLLFGAGVKINVFEIISKEVESNLSIALLSGGIVGLVGQDIYKIMKLVGEKARQLKS